MVRAFKHIFGQEKPPGVLIDFLNAVLGFPGEQKIVPVEMPNPHQAPKLKELKETLLDVKAKNRNDGDINR